MTFKKNLLAGAVLAAVVSGNVLAQEEVNIYSYRQADLIAPVLEQFTKETGIQTNVVFAKSGLAERLQREGELSPADVVLTTDISRLVELKQKGLVQAVASDEIADNVPAQYRDPDNEWVALTTRVRNIYSSKERLPNQAFTYEELADPKYKGKICTRSGKHPYNVALVASMIAHHGEADTKTWLEGVKANLARKPQGNDRDQVKAIRDGVCDLSLGNSYYYGMMLQDENQRVWADAVYINFPNQANRGAHVNVSGMALAKHAPHKDSAVKLMEYLTEDHAQQIFAEVNMEYPVKAGVKASGLVQSWGEFQADSLPLAEVAQYRQAAMKLLDEVKFDL